MRTRTKIKTNIAYRRIAGELFIVDASKAELHELNGPAALIWEGLAAGKPAAGIVSSLTAEFEIDEKTASADLKAFAEELEKVGLLCREIA